MLQNFSYRARTVQNQVVTGVVEAASSEAARKILVQHQLTPIQVKVPRHIGDYIPFFGKSVSLKERSLFTRQLATMIEAGLTLSQGLRLLVRQGRKGYFKEVIESILSDLQDGFSFSSSLAKYPDVFDTIYVNVVRSGEATGKLEEVLLQLAGTIEKDVKIRGKIRGALMYPAFIVMVMIGVAILMLTKVIPSLKDVFSEAGQQLPLSTRILLGISNFFVQDWYWVIMIGAVVIISLRIFLRSTTGIRFISLLSLKLPIAGPIVEQSTMARFGRLLGMLLGSGVPLLESLRLINDSFTNRVFKNAMTDVSSQVERGVPMSVPISQNPIFPLMVGQMVSVGEQTGKMDEVMKHLADYYEAEVDTKVSSLATLIEPAVIVLLGVGVAWLVIAILMPIYQISTAV